MTLTFDQLRRANRERQPQFRNGRGALCHKPRELTYWVAALCGEVGEAANIVKKIERGDFTLDDGRKLLADELADVMTYLDLLAAEAGINLAQATREKFNQVSQRVGVPTVLPTRRMVYLACPHSHPDAAVRQQRFEAVTAKAAELFRDGAWVYSPISHTHHIAQHLDGWDNWESWADYDRHMLSLCTELVVLKLPGWDDSRGVKAELRIANELGLPVKLIEP